MVELGPEDVRTLVASLPQNAHAPAISDLNALEQLVRAEVVQRAVLAEARAKNFDHDPATLKQLEHLQGEAITRLWLASKATVPGGYPTDAEVNTAYEAARKAAPLDYHLAQIFIAAPDGGDSAKLAAAIRKAAEISAKIATADFAQLAREQSEEPGSASKGGDLGVLPENRLLTEIQSAVRSLKPGETAGPIKTAQGLHFLKLLDKKPEAMPPLAEVRERIVNALRARRAQELERAYLSDLAAKLGVTINQIELAKLQASLR
jgi:parvulin-like peptidyl-prolyl isomerase